ncbi:hypothetical protein K469DRAFT_752905 [Zopfia rhizophila CBS 207.26]|uniref:Protein kinase domain-containing protein n=1 Tax=Zopfia rhizophila CBS 207.26 TaxID=1314779 RepID=A0A6A6DRZ8_9PEZI|nr:hypothetical protein K469DRAFT_752905 [Zopfia rhizophila CBS 207.26]
MSAQEETYDRRLPQEHSSAIQSKSAEKSRDKYTERLATPITAFEASASFRPEAYTNVEVTPRLFSHSEYQELVTEYTQTNRYAMFYCKSPRHWIRLTMSITISVESRYWDLLRVAPGRDVLSQQSYGLPTGLNSMVDTFLRDHPDFEQDGHLSLYIGAGPANTALQISRPRFQATEYLKRATKFLYHLNCPRYKESALIQRPLRTQCLNREFITIMQSQWVQDYRFGSDKAQIDASLYVLQVLHCLRGAPGIDPFVGVILDEQSEIIKSFLTKFSSGGDLSDYLTQPVAWERGEKWCRQIVQGVAAVHSKGFVVGFLGSTLNCGIKIDGEDNAVLGRFQTIFTFDPAITGRLPPEYRHLELIEGSLTALPQTDIYKLGLLLWRIAANKHSQPTSAFCKIAGCTTRTGTICTERHIDPIQLPAPGEDTLQYLRQVIAACRAEDPDQRPPACEILKMFTRQANNTLLAETKGDAEEQSSGEHRDMPLEEGKVEDYTRLKNSLADRGQEQNPGGSLQT